MFIFIITPVFLAENSVNFKLTMGFWNVDFKLMNKVLKIFALCNPNKNLLIALSKKRMITIKSKVYGKKLTAKKSKNLGKYANSVASKFTMPRRGTSKAMPKLSNVVMHIDTMNSETNSLFKFFEKKLYSQNISFKLDYKI